MDPISRGDMYVAPVALDETATGNAGLPIVNLPDEVLITTIFSYLGSRDLSQACRRFNALGRTAWQRRAQAIFRTCAELLPPFGSTPPGADAQWQEAITFLDKTVRRVRKIKNSFPKDLRPQFSTNDLVCKVGPGHMQEFLQKAYDHSLRTMFGELAHVPASASLENSVRLIREWLQTAEARGIQGLRLESRGLFCLPEEIGQLTATRSLPLLRRSDG